MQCVQRDQRVICHYTATILPTLSSTTYHALRCENCIGCSPVSNSCLLSAYSCDYCTVNAHSFIQSFVLSFIQSFTHAFIHPFMLSCILHPSIYPDIHPSTHPSIHLLNCLFIHSCILKGAGVFPWVCTILSSSLCEVLSWQSAYCTLYRLTVCEVCLWLHTMHHADQQIWALLLCTNLIISSHAWTL